MPRNANSAAATTDTIDIEWGDPVADAAEHSDRASRAAARLIALGVDPVELEVYTGAYLPAPLCPSTRHVADGWFYMGRQPWISHTTGAKFSHPLYVRTCYLVAHVRGVEVAIEISDIRYGAHGRLRQQPIRIGAPCPTRVFEAVTFEGPMAMAARAALGLT